MKHHLTIIPRLAESIGRDFAQATPAVKGLQNCMWAYWPGSLLNTIRFVVRCGKLPEAKRLVVPRVSLGLALKRTRYFESADHPLDSL